MGYYMTIRVNAWITERSSELKPILPNQIEDLEARFAGGMGFEVEPSPPTPRFRLARDPDQSVAYFF